MPRLSPTNGSSQVNEKLFPLEHEAFAFINRKAPAPADADESTNLFSWFKPSLHIPATGAVQRAREVGVFGEGVYGRVSKAEDLDTGCYAAVKKKIRQPRRVGSTESREEIMLRREIDVLSKISHENIVEYLGLSGLGSKTVSIYMGLKEGSVHDLVKKSPQVRTNGKVIRQLLHGMLKALDYLASQNWLHRDVKPQNILYTSLGDDNYHFQLADFGLANRKRPREYVVWYSYLHGTGGDGRSAGGLCKLEVLKHKDVLQCVRSAAAEDPLTSPMAREDPALRASAAQMLVRCFEGDGLSTARDEVKPIPNLGSAPVPHIRSLILASSAPAA